VGGRVEIKVAVDTGGRGEFNFERVVRADFCGTDECGADFVLFEIKEMGAGQRGGGFELESVLAEQRRRFILRGEVPGGFAVVSQNFRLFCNDEFEVIAIREFGIEGESAGFAVGSAG